jgi:glycosyltransferase involved in cell wall biosynthesis
VRAATRTVEAVIEKENPDLLFVTTSPFPAARVVELASKKYSIPWVLDMRDPWALDPISHYPTKLHWHMDMDDMKKSCNNATAVIMNTPSALDAAISALGSENRLKFHCITNGWDKVDFQAPKVQMSVSCKPMKIVHTGMFHTRSAVKLKKKRTPMDALRFSHCGINLLTRSPNYLFAAYRKLIDGNKLEHDSIKFIFAGNSTVADIALVEKYKMESCVEFRGYLSHSKSIDLLQHADVLFLPLHEMDDYRDPLIVPGKTYEYLAAEKPILACIPKGDARKIVQQSGLGYISDPSDVDQIAQRLIELVGQFNSDKGILVRPNYEHINCYERRNLTKKLANVFDLVLTEEQQKIKI